MGKLAILWYDVLNISNFNKFLIITLLRQLTLSEVLSGPLIVHRKLVILKAIVDVTSISFIINISASLLIRKFVLFSYLLQSVITESSTTFKVFLSLHSYGEVIIFPWGYTDDPCPDYVELLEGGTAMAKVTITVFQSDDLATLKHFKKSILHKYSLTCEQ